MKPKEAKEKSSGKGFQNAYDHISHKDFKSRNGVEYWYVLRELVNGLEQDGYKVFIQTSEQKE